MRILGVNGIRSTGKASTDMLGWELSGKGHHFIDVNQPVRSAWGARWKAEQDAKAIISLANEGDVVIAHSYGCLKTSIAMRGIRFDSVFLFRPAMSRRHKFYRLINGTKVYCIYSPGDWTIRLGGILWFHPFGFAGLKGFKDPFVTNLKSEGGHSEDFRFHNGKYNVNYWADWIDDKLNGANYEEI